MAGLASRLAWSAALAAAVAAVSAGAAVGAADGPAATDWRSANYDETANRYSPLDQITAHNVATLQQVWSFHLKPAGFTGRLREDEAIPLVIGNTMYLASPYGAVHALDATTGAEKWTFQLPNNDLPSKRGIAYWPGADGVPASIIFGGLSGGLYSIKASDGTLNAGFGENGVVNLKTPEVMQTGMNATYSLLSSADHLQEPRSSSAPAPAKGLAAPMAAPDPRATRARGTRGPASWSGPSTPCRGRASSATTRGARTARRTAPA